MKQRGKKKVGIDEREWVILRSLIGGQDKDV